MLERVIFWSLLIFISAHLLRKFYFSASVEKMKRLRYAALATEIAALALFYFSWVPKFISGDTGFQLVAAGNADVIIVFGLIAGAILLFLFNSPRSIRVGAISHIAASVIFMGVLLRLLPESYPLLLDESAPIFIILLLSGLITAAFYLSYPQINQYAPAKFFSLSDSDLKAVRLIEQIANPEHIVLANQMIGVAAIKEFGFKKYYNNQFYYSMPNGSPRTFYDRYLDMIYQGTKPEFMYLALNEAGAAEAYFVLNRYWRDAEKIAEQARQSATAVYEIDNGEVYIFKYERN